MADKYKIQVDFSQATDSGRVRVDPGKYPVEVANAKVETSKAGNEMIVVYYRFLDGPAEGRTIRDNFVLLPQSLWVLRNFLESIGLNVPGKKVPLDVRKFKGRKLVIEVSDAEPYNGRVSSEVDDYLPADADTSGSLDLSPDPDDEDDGGAEAEAEVADTDDDDDDEAVLEDIEDFDLDEIA